MAVVLKISFFSKNNGIRVQMCRTLKIDLFICYNFHRQYFFPGSIFINIKWKNLLKTFFLVLTLKIKFPGIFIIIFVISASKYVVIVSFKLIGAKWFFGSAPLLYLPRVFTNFKITFVSRDPKKFYITLSSP